MIKILDSNDPKIWDSFFKTYPRLDVYDKNKKDQLAKISSAILSKKDIILSAEGYNLFEELLTTNKIPYEKS